ncbi:nucleotide sugar dehydrogenase [Anaerocolumna xylanovorans]|uniref:UDP-N-acetyl-D-galactosamine dehydrogenase n=1 Tax=Anaerocolumna xylanovorans DSM 12503 TaxID=1121345 RepID=A0A1M7Y1M7_9FIRM|nr:nucleotide sugar dehydrogenase [Anaerocolumna xylanovorans]SHO45709.1 UDP-N-acetyl-D-galactosamine dehydrogenase [Anaerocolumna xylanovorans DSM 12503]
MSLAMDLLNKKESLSVVGLGYVGMPLALAFSKVYDVIGYDISIEVIKKYQMGIDPTREVGDEAIKEAAIEFTNDEEKLRMAKFHIIAVPTPVTSYKMPDLNPVETASKIVGRNLLKGSVVVYESTVYPGVTEEICIPILEKASGLTCGKDFKVGYSPERINPGDKVHRLESIRKIVSGMDEESLKEIAEVYSQIITAGVYPVSSIKVAEAAKVVENSQRDINIAFMNELAMVFDRMQIDTKEVIEAMSSKWNSLNFYPGLVGGHCIGVDPYYFIFEAERLGYHSQIILSGRKINDAMGEYIADIILKKLILTNRPVKDSKVVILGITFKENCPDIRNTKIVDICEKLKEYGIKPVVSDPLADRAETKKHYGIELVSREDIKEADCIVFAVAHDEYKALTEEEILKMFRTGKAEERVLIDIKGILDKKGWQEKGYQFWRL